MFHVVTLRPLESRIAKDSFVSILVAIVSHASCINILVIQIMSPILTFHWLDSRPRVSRVLT